MKRNRKKLGQANAKHSRDLPADLPTNPPTDRPTNLGAKRDSDKPAIVGRVFGVPSRRAVESNRDCRDKVDLPCVRASCVRACVCGACVVEHEKYFGSQRDLTSHEMCA